MESRVLQLSVPNRNWVLCVNVVGPKEQGHASVFDIDHRGEVFLDDEGEQFSSLGAGCDHLARVLCEFVHSGGEFENNMVVNITDRGKLRLVLPITDIMPEPLARNGAADVSAD